MEIIFMARKWGKKREREDRKKEIRRERKRERKKEREQKKIILASIVLVVEESGGQCNRTTENGTRVSSWKQLNHTQISTNEKCFKTNETGENKCD